MKIKNLYNLESFKQFLDSGSRKGFKDAAAGVVLDRYLTQVDPKIFEKLYPELAFMNSGVVVDNSGGYARRIQSLRIIDQGEFTTSGDASSDKGKISLYGEDSYLKVLVREAFSSWNDDEINEASLANVNLVSRFIEGHNKIYQREIDEIGFIGIPDVTASKGLLNYASFTSGAAAGAISTLTAQEMYDEMADLITAQWSAVNNTPGYMANKVIMPVSISNTLTKTILNSASTPRSVMVALTENFPSIGFSSTFRAESVSATTVTIAFSNSEEVMKMRIPIPLTVGQIVPMTSFDWRVDSKYRVAGLDILEDSGGRILTGL